MALMCQGQVLFEPVELAYLIDFKRYFSTEMEAIAKLGEQELLTLDDNGIFVSEMGWFFVRAVAMVFDRHLQTDRTRARFSRII
jgi:oxygen-independent coproporphyrinogen-3 oxidase